MTHMPICAIARSEATWQSLLINLHLIFKNYLNITLILNKVQYCEEVREYFKTIDADFDIEDAKIYWNIAGNSYEKIN
jgi:hypothetical protein